MADGLVKVNEVIERLERVAERLESAGGATSAQPRSGADPFRGFLSANLDPVKAAAEKDPELVKVTTVLSNVFEHIRDLIVMASICKKPGDSEWAPILEKTMAICREASAACDNR